MDGSERRAHPRVDFSAEDGISVLLERSSRDGSESMLIHARVTSLSEGGISFIGQNPALINLQAGDILKLIRVTEPETLTFLHDVTMNVRHSVYEEETEHILAGCAFLDMSPEQRVLASRFVSAHLPHD